MGHHSSFWYSTLHSFFLNVLQATICLLLGWAATSAPLMGKATAGWFLSSPGASDVKGVMRITAAMEAELWESRKGKIKGSKVY